MKNKQTYRTTLTFLLAFLTLFQSCTVYKKQAVSLEEAVQAHKKTRITMVNGTVKKYRYVTYRDLEYYGVKKSKWNSSETMEEILPEQSVSAVHIKHVKNSNTLSIVLLGLPVAGLLAYGIWYFSTGDWIDCIYWCN